MDPLSLFLTVLLCMGLSFVTVKTTDRLGAIRPTNAEVITHASHEAAQVVELRFDAWIGDIEGRHATTRSELSERIAEEASAIRLTISSLSQDVHQLMGKMEMILQLYEGAVPGASRSAAQCAMPDATATQSVQT